jgi:hypothetical protein
MTLRQAYESQSVQTKTDNFFKPVLLCSKITATSESSINEYVLKLWLYSNILIIILISITYIIQFPIYLRAKFLFWGYLSLQ